MILGTDGKGQGRDFYDKPDGELLHLTNWVECVRSASGRTVRPRRACRRRRRRIWATSLIAAIRLPSGASDR